MRLSRNVGAFVVALLVTSGACSLVIDTDPVQCQQAADCAALGYPGAECVDNLCAADTAFLCRDVPFPEQTGETVDFSLKVVNLVNQQPYPGLTVRACLNLDPGCGNPVGETMTDTAGDFTLALEEGFLGHLYIPPPPEDPDLVPLNAHIFPPPSNDPAVPVRAGLVVTRLETITGLATLAGRTIEPGTGHLFFTAINCQGLPLEGVTVSSSVQTPETLVAYLGTSGQPDLALLGTGTTGQGAMINVPGGFVTISGLHKDKGLIFEQSVLVAADEITSVPIVPSPTP